MLYHLLYPLAGRFGVLNVLRDPSFRIVAAGLPALVAWTVAAVRPGDVLLVKGSRGMRLERLVEALR